MEIKNNSTALHRSVRAGARSEWSLLWFLFKMNLNQDDCTDFSNFRLFFNQMKNWHSVIRIHNSANILLRNEVGMEPNVAVVPPWAPRSARGATAPMTGSPPNYRCGYCIQTCILPLTLSEGPTDAQCEHHVQHSVLCRLLTLNIFKTLNLPGVEVTRVWVFELKRWIPFGVQC